MWFEKHVYTLLYKAVTVFQLQSERSKSIILGEKKQNSQTSVSPWPSVNLVVTIWINNGVVKNLGRRLHGETSCKPFGPLHEAVCQTKWKAAGRRSTCLVKTSVFFGLWTHHPHFTELSLKPLGKVRVPICAWSMLSFLLPIPAEALPRADTVFPHGANGLMTGYLCPQASCLLKNMLSKNDWNIFPLFILHFLSSHIAFYISLLACNFCVLDEEP